MVTHNKVPFLFGFNLDIASAVTEETHRKDSASQAQENGLAGLRRLTLSTLSRELAEDEVVDTVDVPLLRGGIAKECLLK